MGLEGHRGLEQRNPESPGCYGECVGMGLRKGEPEILRWLPYDAIFFPPSETLWACHVSIPLSEIHLLMQNLSVHFQRSPRWYVPWGCP